MVASAPGGQYVLPGLVCLLAKGLPVAGEPALAAALGVKQMQLVAKKFLHRAIGANEAFAQRKPIGAMPVVLRHVSGRVGGKPVGAGL